MTYVITEPCMQEKAASCVEVCPVDCIHSDEDSPQNYIDPDACIDCGACVGPCPTDAIYPADEVPARWRHSVEVNAQHFRDGRGITSP
jgi:NAD-dependent dihydropyrimidine dehydrogenase PreA subunit